MGNKKIISHPIRSADYGNQKKIKNKKWKGRWPAKRRGKNISPGGQQISPRPTKQRTCRQIRNKGKKGIFFLFPMFHEKIIGIKSSKKKIATISVETWKPLFRWFLTLLQKKCRTSNPNVNFIRVGILKKKKRTR